MVLPSLDQPKALFWDYFQFHKPNLGFMAWSSMEGSTVNGTTPEVKINNQYNHLGWLDYWNTEETRSNYLQYNVISCYITNLNINPF
jgi:hypothetical protein